MTQITPRDFKTKRRPKPYSAPARYDQCDFASPEKVYQLLGIVPRDNYVSTTNAHPERRDNGCMIYRSGS